MERAARLLAAVLLALVPHLARGAAPPGFDAPSQTTLSCPGFRDALARPCSFRFGRVPG